MVSEIQKSIVAGIVGTAVMTAVVMIAPMMGMPKMSPPEMLSGMLGMPLFVGWLMHFVIGIMFAFAYIYFCQLRLKISNVWLRGVAFGVIVFMFARIVMAILGAMVAMPATEGAVILTIMGSLLGHIVFGMAVSKTVGEAYCADKSFDANPT